MTLLRRTVDILRYSVECASPHSPPQRPLLYSRDAWNMLHQGDRVESMDGKMVGIEFFSVQQRRIPFCLFSTAGDGSCPTVGLPSSL